MKILVLSDSHSKTIDFNLDEFDYTFFAGDAISSDTSNMISVRGNCDYLGDIDRFITINNVNFYITHGHIFNVKSSLNRLFYRALSVDAKICIYGHTHIQSLNEVENIIFLNPGAYKDGYYAIIDDKYIRLYKDKKELKKFEFKW